MIVLAEKKEFNPPEKTAILDYLAANRDKDVSFDKIKTQILSPNLPDGTIHQVAIDAGYEVEIE